MRSAEIRWNRGHLGRVEKIGHGEHIRTSSVRSIIDVEGDGVVLQEWVLADASLNEDLEQLVDDSCIAIVGNVTIKGIMIGTGMGAQKGYERTFCVQTISGQGYIGSSCASNKSEALVDRPDSGLSSSIRRSKLAFLDPMIWSAQFKMERWLYQVRS